MATASLPDRAERSSLRLPSLSLVVKLLAIAVVIATLAIGIPRLLDWLEPVQEVEAATLRGTSSVEVRDLVATGDASGTIEFADTAVVVHRVDTATSQATTPVEVVTAAPAPSSTDADAAADGARLSDTAPTVASAGQQSSVDQQSAADQVVTWLPDVGSIISNGDVAYRVNDEPTVLIIGSTPVTRSLSILSEDGPDVAQLERFLSTAGFDPDGELTVDEDFTTATATAIERWQTEIGAPVTGAADLGSYAVAAQPWRVAGHRESVRSSINDGSALLEVTSTDRVVHVELDPVSATAVPPGTAVQIRLADRSLHDATVLTVAPSTADGTAAVVVATDDPESLPPLNGVNVTLLWTDSKATAALVVAAEALVRLDSGVYAVEVVDSLSAEDARAGVDAETATRLVPVEVGVTSAGWVEIVGTGLERGTVVVSP